MGAPATDNDAFAEGRAIAVEMPMIEAALRQLWMDEKNEHGVVRACVLNLIIVANDEAEANLAGEAVARLTTSHPCRALVLLGDEAAERAPALQAWLSAHCQAPKPNGQRVCCEQVTIQAAGAAVDHLPSAVLPLLVPDLPVVLWWMGEPPFGAPLFDQLVDVCDRLIIDTRTFQDPTFSLTQLASLIRHKPGRQAVSDLNWARLTPWREQLAQAFDSIDTLPYLERLERVAIRYARQAGGSSEPEQALLLAGWLLNRTGWKLPPALTRPSPGSFRGRLRRAGRDLLVEIAPLDAALSTERPDDDGMISGVELRSRLGEREASFRFERRPEEPDSLRTQVMLGEYEPLVVTRVLPRQDRADLLGEDLGRFETDYLFEAALDIAAHLSGGAGRPAP